MRQVGRWENHRVLNLETVNSQPSTRCAIEIVDESNDWIVVNKPPFLEVHPSKPTGRFTLWHGLRELLAFEIANGGQVSIINRLDRETSGLTLIAKSRGAARHFHQQMERRAIGKEYLAIVWGWPVADTFRVDLPILRQGEKEPFRIYLKQMCHPDGAPARTDFQVMQRFTRPSSNGSEFALIRCVPETGRMHQIRVHLAHSGHPVVGDKIYGPDEGCYLEFIDQGWTPALEQRLLLPRHALHSTRMFMSEPQLDWHSPLPSDLSGWIEEKDEL